MSHGPKQKNSDFEKFDMFEEEEDEEDIGWTSGFLRSKLKEHNEYLKYFVFASLIVD